METAIAPGFGPLNNQSLDTSRALTVVLTKDSQTTIESVEFEHQTTQQPYQTKKYWVIIYKNQTAPKELIRYQACETAVELKISNENETPLTFLITHWSEIAANEFEQCDLTSEQNSK